MNEEICTCCGEESYNMDRCPVCNDLVCSDCYYESEEDRCMDCRDSYRYSNEAVLLVCNM